MDCVKTRLGTGPERAPAASVSSASSPAMAEAMRRHRGASAHSSTLKRRNRSAEAPRSPSSPTRSGSLGNPPPIHGKTPGTSEGDRLPRLPRAACATRALCPRPRVAPCAAARRRPAFPLHPGRGLGVRGGTIVTFAKGNIPRATPPGNPGALPRHLLPVVELSSLPL